MARSAHTAAAVTLTTEAGADALVAARADLVAALAGTDAPPPTYNDFFARLVAVALRDFPDLNASLTDDGIMRHAAVHVGLAVDTERGLLVPVLRDVQAKSVQVIAGESARLIAAARAGQSAPADLQGAPSRSRISARTRSTPSRRSSTRRSARSSASGGSSRARSSRMRRRGRSPSARGWRSA
jgi:pyruvate/2-oxoglutarate dehydrogenase complex dihydrolipoamide acyltransferase (E2) component